METIIIINDECFGRGDEVLGKKLMGAFLKKIWIRQEKPSTIIFYNAGVKLLAKGSPVLDALNGLYEAGIELIGCGTCIDFYNLKDQLMVGRISNMEEIVDTMMNANHVITI